MSMGIAEQADARQVADKASVGRPLSATTATPLQRTTGILMVMGSSASAQAGAAIGALAFPVIGPVGVVAVRQLVTAAVLSVTVRPRWRSLTRRQWWLVLALGLVFGIMNLALYTAVDRIGLALAVTIEFLGPMAVAIIGSRRLVDLGCALLAGVGVVVLANPGPSSDLLGILFALLAAASWSACILLNRSIGQQLPGLQGTAAASTVAAVLWLPIALAWFGFHPPTVWTLLAAAACAVLASLVPYVADLLALRRVPANIFGTLSSVHPVWAALAGWLILNQALDTRELIGMVLIISSNLVISLARTGSRPEAGGSPHLAEV